MKILLIKVRFGLYPHALKIRFTRYILVISDLNEDIEYSIPISFIVILATFSDVNEALKAKFDLKPGSIIKKYLFTRK